MKLSKNKHKLRICSLHVLINSLTININCVALKISPRISNQLGLFVVFNGIELFYGRLIKWFYRYFQKSMFNTTQKRKVCRNTENICAIFDYVMKMESLYFWWKKSQIKTNRDQFSIFNQKWEELSALKMLKITWQQKTIPFQVVLSRSCPFGKLWRRVNSRELSVCLQQVTPLQSHCHLRRSLRVKRKSSPEFVYLNILNIVLNVLRPNLLHF